LKHKSDVNFVNEHGNTALHYAAFWQNEECAEDLVECGSLVTIENKYGESPLEKAPGRMAKRLMGELSYIFIAIMCLKSI
jgi:integrin-linked kinase